MIRRAPRIMARRPHPYSQPSTSRDLDSHLFDDEDATNAVVVNGVMLAYKNTTPKDSSSYYPTSVPSPSAHVEYGGGSEDVPYFAESNGDNTKSAFKTEVPHFQGLSDDVEAYPCHFCENNRVFLTGEGLQRHTREIHPDCMEAVIAQVEKIREEWQRREAEREKHRQRAYLHRLRQQVATSAAIRHAQAGARSGLYNPATASSDDKYEACELCGLLINMRHPTALKSHMRAHEKNEELREQMIRDYGAELVRRLTCHECHLVFTDEMKLLTHSETMHVRRRKYVCKYCGHVCLSVAELNAHKQDVHAIRTGGFALTRLLPPSVDLRLGPPLLGVKNPALTMPHLDATMPRLTPICKTSCEVCGLSMVRPSLLIRHMLRVHNKTEFEATIEMRSVAPYRVKVNGPVVRWTCCDHEFNDRQEFHAHRRNIHPPQKTRTPMSGLHQRHHDDVFAQHHIGDDREEDGRTGNENVVPQIIDMHSLNPGEAIHGELVSGPDGTVQVIVSEPMDSSQVYTLVMLGDEDGELKPVLARIPENERYDSPLVDGVAGEEDFIAYHNEMGAEDGPSYVVDEVNDGGGHLEKPLEPATEMPDTLQDEDDQSDVVTFTETQWNELRMQYGDQMPTFMIQRDNGDMIPARVAIVKDEEAGQEQQHEAAEDDMGDVVEQPIVESPSAQEDPDASSNFVDLPA